jgi:predicted  nucleic acid-binding Zn-ribbon protein
MEKNLSYLERIKERQRIISEINSLQLQVDEINRKISDVELEIEGFKMKINVLEKEIEIRKKKIEQHTKEKRKFENMMKELDEKYVKKGIPVPENEGYEISNGIPNMKRDINLKLVVFLNDDKVRQVYCLFYLFYFIFSYLE